MNKQEGAIAIDTGDADLIVEVLREASDNGWPEPCIGAEVGVYRGETSAKLLREFENLRLIMVDRWSPPLGDDDKPWLDSGDSCAKQAMEHHSANYSAAWEATDFCDHRRRFLTMKSDEAARFVNPGIDFAFLDDDHSYDGVTLSLRSWYPLIRPGGILAGHDYGHPRNARGLFGVDRAVSELLVETGCELQTKGSVWWIVKE